MSIFRKSENGTWYFSVYVPGKTKRLRGTCGTTCRDEAELVEHTMRLAVRGATPRDRLIRTINALFPETNSDDDASLPQLRFAYIRAARIAGKDKGENHRRKQHAIDRLVSFLQAEHPRAESLRTIDRRAAQAFAERLRASGLTAKSRKNLLALLSSVWTILQRHYDGLENPWPLAMPLEVEDNVGRAFSAEDAKNVIRAADAIGHGWGLACRIAAATGLRLGDVVHLRGEDIVDGVIVLNPNKTRRWKIRVVLPLPADVAARIPRGSGWLMPELAKYDGNRERDFSLPFSAVLERAGLKEAGYTFHSWRHYFRTQLSKAGVREDVAMRLGGWTQRDTAARYDHDEHRAELAAAIGAAWKLGDNG